MRRFTRLLYPFSIGLGLVLGYAFGGFLGGPLDKLTIETPFEDFDEQTWSTISQVVLTLYTGCSGAWGYRAFERISNLREYHALTYWEERDEVETPGSPFSNFIWAYSYALAMATTLFLIYGVIILSFVASIIEFNLVWFGISVGILYIAPYSVEFITNIISELFEPRDLEKEINNSSTYKSIIRDSRRRKRAQRKRSEEQILVEEDEDLLV